MYKDKEKQREANRLAKQRQRGKEGMTQGKELTLEVAKEIEASTPAVEGYDFKVPERAKVLPPEVIKGIFILPGRL